MKILTVVYDLGKGGTQRAAQNFCEAYQLNGHDSRMLALYDGGPRAAELLKAGIEVWVGLSKRIAGLIALWQPALIHLHAHALRKEEVYALKQLCPEARFVETNVFSKPTAYEDILDYSYQLSEWCRYLYLSRGGSAKKCFIVPYPVKVDGFYKASPEECFQFREKHHIPQDAFLFGRIGQNYPGKWSPYLIDVFERFLFLMHKHTPADSPAQAPAYLLLVNPPTSILEYVARKNLSDRVIHIDRIMGDEALRISYAAMDVFLHIANQGESFGLVLAESLLCQTPVITLNTPWDDNSQAEVIGNSEGGFCANTIEEFLHLAIKLFRDTALRKKLGSQGRKSIIDRYDYRLIAQKSMNIVAAGAENNEMLPAVVLAGIRNHESHTRLLTEFLISLKGQHHLSHRVVNFLLRRLANFKISGNFQR